jgi:cyanophycin synthetase
MADHTQAAAIWYVTMSPVHHLVRAHIQAGGGAVVLEAGINGHMITLYQGGAQMPLLWTHLIPATLEGKALHNVQNAMFAAGMAYAMGVKLDDIRAGLRTFDTSFYQAPGRLNIFDQHPFRVILDYGHNPAAVRAMVQLTDGLDVRGRRIVVLGAPGDRRDQDILNIAYEAAGHFDHYICHRDDNPRGRAHDAIPNLLRDALLERGVPAERIEVIPEEVPALDAALRMAARGDLVLVFGDQITRCWKQITRFRPDGQEPLVRDPVAARIELERFVDAPDTAGEALVRDERGVRLSRETED